MRLPQPSKRQRGNQLKLSLINWIWHIKGSLALTPELSSDDAFERLAPLFREPGTTYTRDNTTLLFEKKNQSSQDRMSIFDKGILFFTKDAKGLKLHYDLTSRMLLFCFLAPFLFLGVAKFFEYTAANQKHQHEVQITQGRHGNKVSDTQQKKIITKAVEVPMNPIDKALGMPASPQKDSSNNSENPGRRKISPTPAYVFAALFGILYVVGRILESRLIKHVFQKNILNT